MGSSDVVLSAGVRSNLLALQRTDGMMTRTQERLATGKKVNSALDNPINFFTASALTNRASDLASLLDGVGNAIKTLQAADNGISAIKKLVENAQAIAMQALQNPATTAKYSGTVAGLTGASTLAVTAGDTITVSDGTTTATFTADATPTVQEFLDAVNNTANLNVKAELSSDGRILLEATGTNSITIAGDMVAGEKALLGIVDGTTAGGPLNATRTTLARQFNAVLDQIDKLARDTGFNGINLINGGSLKVIFNENQTSSLTISGVTIDSAGLGLTAAGSDFQSDFNVNATLTQLRSGLDALASHASAFGSNLSMVQVREDFMESMINTLKTGADNLTLADPNEEGANMLALQTRQQLSTTALSLASQASQNVLRLFG
jgi:flagellin